MGRLRSLVLVALLLGGTFVLAGAGIDRDDSGRGMFSTPIDSFSTFEIGSLSGIFPTHTDTLPVYLHTDSLVTYIECHIYWNDTDLELDDAVRGPGIPELATFNHSSPEDSIVVIEILYANNPFSIPSGEPIAYLIFEVQCYGYGQETQVKFTDNASENVFVCNGVLYSPLHRLAGSIWTANQSNSYLLGEDLVEYAGDQDMSMGFDLDQSVPGKLLKAHFQYSMQYLQFDSVTVGEDLQPGDTVYAYEENDTLYVTLPETNQFLTAGRLRIFDLHFSALAGIDNYTSYVVHNYAERLDECGGMQYPSWGYNTIRVNNHTATVDIGDVSYYTSAEVYDVWVKMGSNYPINSYNFWVEFPADKIAFDTIVVYQDYTPPLGTPSLSDSTKLSIVSDIGTDYQPSAPIIVFKMRFNRLIYLASGTVLPITIWNGGPKGIYYEMDAFGFHEAETTWLDGKITITTPHHHCPTLFAWNGTAFEEENTILAECDGKVVENDVTDYYLISRTTPVPDGALRFQIREDGEEISAFSGFRLLVVDHPRKRPIHVTRDGSIITIGQPHSIVWARDHKGSDITELIGSKDAVPYISTESGWFDVNFGKVSPEEIEGFAVLSIDKPKEEPETPENIAATDLPRSKKLDVSMKLADGSWRLIASEDARLVPATQATMIDPALVSPDRELVLRYSWDDYYKIDFLDFRTAEPFEGEPTELDLASANHSAAGEVRTMLGGANVDAPVTLVQGEAIDLAFDISPLPPYSRNTKRDYIFVATGRYHKEGKKETPRAEFALDANFPNPFNPATTIRYNLAKPTYVELRIYDVRGALVRTLVSEHQAAGEKQVTWDGRLDSGATAASGVYFYKLKTAGFNQTRKMILLK